MFIKELTLLTDDIQGTRHFYKNVLGIKLISGNKTRLSFRAGTTKLNFAASDYPEPFYHFAFNIPHNKFEEAYNIIDKTVGVTPSAEDASKRFDFTSWNAQSFYFYDNNRNILEFIARFDLPNSINAPFKNTDIQCISEVGISVDDVSLEGKKIIQKYGLDYFSKQKPLEDFAAIGDDNGLFILGTTHRFWFPTHQRGEKHTTKIKFEAGGKTREIEYP